MRAVEQTAADLYDSDRSTQEAKDEYPESAIDELTSRHADMLLPDGLDGRRYRDLFQARRTGGFCFWTDCTGRSSSVTFL
jgi:hypothetical protein